MEGVERFIGDEELELLRETVESQVLQRGGWRGVPGQFVKRFEEAFAAYTGAQYVLAVNSGTSALQAALAGAGIGPGDEVIVTSCSFIASSIAVVLADAIPVFADVDPVTFLIDPEDVARKIGPRTKAILPVHWSGQVCAMDRLMEIAAAHNLLVIEDCAQAYSCRYRGAMAGTIGHVGAFSLQQSKHITTGEGGLVITDDRAIYERACLFANLGMTFIHEAPPRGGHHFAGMNLRMGELQAAVGLAQLPKIERFNAARARLVEIVEQELRNVPGLALARPLEGAEPNYFSYPLRYDPAVVGMSKEEFMRRCREEHGVNVICYPGVPNHLEPVYTTGLYKQGYPAGVRWHPDNPPIGPGLLPVLERAFPETLITLMFHHGDDPETCRAWARAIKETALARAGAYANTARA
jgi:dTDP-4-amino-4,6-dideoxygalactose transaminase